MTDLQPFLTFVTDLAYRAGRITLGYYQSELRPDFKPDDTPVTAADRATEQFIRSKIEKKYPGHAVLGEEFGESTSARIFTPDSVDESTPIPESVKKSTDRIRWLIDPIDGTKSFMRGVPLYAVLIGLEIEGIVRVGAAYFPALDEMLCAADGIGCWWNGRRAHVSEVSSIDRAFVCFTNPRNMEKHGRSEAWERIQRSAYAARGWSDAYGYLLVATGRAEAMLDPVMNIWDCGPFPPIFREAGGYFGDWNGNPTHLGGEALATNQELLPEMLRLIAGN
jgi:myo-inositol-1(or 4)-monophosphatase